MTGDRTAFPRRTLLGAALVSPVALASLVATTGTQDSSGSDAIDLFDFVPSALQPGIRARVVDDSPARAQALAGHIQQAIDTAASQKRRLAIPAGLYNIAPIDTFAAEAGPCRRCFAIRSHMHIDAAPGATLRIVDRVSTDAAVVFMCMFGTDEQLVDLSWRGLAMDMNGRGNPISPGRAAGKYSLINQAHIFISGTPGGRAALASNVLVERCRFLNTPGASSVVLAQSNAPGAMLGSNWRILDCQFIDGGLDSPDHSAVFAWAEDVVCQGCTFSNRLPMGKVGGNVAFEVHGSRQQFTGNKIDNYYQGVWIDGNLSRAVSSDIVVSGNTFANMGGYGVMFYGTRCRMSDVRIAENSVAFNDIVYPGVDLKIGIGCLSPLGQRRTVITGNKVSSASRRTASSGVSLQSPTGRGELHDGFVIEKNVFDHTTFGTHIVTNRFCEMGSITVRSNQSFNLSRAGAFELPQGVAVDFQGASSLIRDLVVLDNTCVDNRGAAAQCAFGIRIQGKVSSLRVSGNTASGMTAAPYAEGRLTVIARQSPAP
jgi:hypothetical protein